MFNYNFKKIIAALNTGIYIYSFPDMKVLDSTIFKYETGYNWRIAISPDSSSFAVGTYDGMLRLFKSDLLSDVNDDNNNEFIGQSNLSYLYPNPASDNINFENQSLFSGNIEVYSITGTKLTEQNCISGRTTEIDISGFSRGLYYIKFQNRFYKFVKI
jgi:WD40 repeat protein